MPAIRLYSCSITPTPAFPRNTVLCTQRVNAHPAQMNGATSKPRTGHRSLRRGRCSIPGQYYHVITCTAGRRPIFVNLQYGRNVVRSLKRLQDECVSRSLAFVVMPDHVHWLMQLGAAKSLPACVSTMKSFVTRRIMADGYPVGSIWQRGFMDRAIRREQDLIRVARYIVANPLRAGIVDDIGQYPLWDSVWMDDPGAAIGD